MKKIFILALLALLPLSGIMAQQTQAQQNPDYDYTHGIELAQGSHWAVAAKHFEAYISQNGDIVNQDTVRVAPADLSTKVEDAQFWLCRCLYMLKDAQTLTRIHAHLARYPESAMAAQLHYMEGRLYYDKRDWANTVRALSRVQPVKALRYEDQEALHFILAYSHLQQKQYSEASAGFMAAMSSKHYYNEARYYYAYSEFCLEHYDAALEGFHQVDDNSQFKEAAEFHILQIYDARGQRTAAVEKGHELLERYPKSKFRNEAYRIIGENAYRTQSYNEAAVALHHYMQEQKNPHREDIYMQGLANYQIEEYKDAITALGRLTAETDSFTLNAYLFMGYAYLQLHQPQNASIVFARAAKIEGSARGREEASYNYALATYESKAPFGEIVKAFEAFVTAYPNSRHKTTILEHTAEAYMAENNYQAAIDAIDRMDVTSEKLRQVKETALFRLGVNAMEQKDYDRATGFFTRSIDMNNPKSNSSQAYLWRAECAYKTGNLKAARTDLKQYLQTPQQKTTDCLIKAYYTLAYTYWEQKEYLTARPYFAKIKEIKGSEKHPLYSDVTCRIGDCYYYNRDFENALNTYWSVPVKDKNADYAQYQIAQIYGLQHNYKEKIEALQRLLSRHPESDWNDEAMYEIGRTYVLQDKDLEAIRAYEQLQKNHPMSPWTRKATLEIAMLYANMGKTAEAINAYKFVVDKYPSSEEARVALEGMQSLYVDANRVDDYIQYRQSVAGITVQTVNKTEEDSLQFLAAEKVYMKGDWNVAIGSLNNYIVKYCSELTFNCISAQFYLAEAYYNAGNKQQALIRYDRLTSMDGNQYMEQSLIRAAEITYDKEEFQAAEGYFAKLLLVATTGENRNTARLGMLRSGYNANLYRQTIDAANDIMNQTTVGEEIKREAQYNRAKSYIALHHADSAAQDLHLLSRDNQTAIGSEATYLYAQYLFDANESKQSEAVIMQFIEVGTPHQYWMARCFILLSDIYKSRDDKVMARMYLESLSENYTVQDDIPGMIEQRMKDLE